MAISDIGPRPASLDVDTVTTENAYSADAARDGAGSKYDPPGWTEQPPDTAPAQHAENGWRSG
ncbi:hypothetical protein QFZ61_002590 [Arthrobacter sp. B3I4]|nr:hypothetical protein [Arthrobacter sp. B3I4]